MSSTQVIHRRTNDDRRKTKPLSLIVGHHRPPMLIVSLLGIFIAVFVSTLPSLQVIDDDATITTFTHRIFPQYLSLPALGYIRCIFAAFVLLVSLRGTFIDPGWLQATSYLPESKLQRGVVIEMRGYRTQLPFTSWSWNLLGLSFFLNGIIVLLAVDVDIDDDHNNKTTSDEQPYYVINTPWLLRTALLLFEISAPTTLLVAAVVRYAIWPRCLEAADADTSSSKQLKGFQALVMHNANVIMALTETTLLGGLPIRLTHFAVAPLFGITYIFFSWFMMNRWVPSDGDDGRRRGGTPQFIYFFFDTTLGVEVQVVALLSLLVLLMSFFGLFGALHQTFNCHPSSSSSDEQQQQYRVIVHVLAVALVSSVVCRFRD